MSVAALPSPARVGKRTWEEENTNNVHFNDYQALNKRTRIARNQQGGLRCVHPLQALLALFPGMDEKVVHDVLIECNNSIDAAIKRLTDLSLSTEDATVAAATAAAAAHGAPSDQASSSHAGQQVPQQASAPVSPLSIPPQPEPSTPQTAEQWIEYLVAEMLASKDMPDAKGRAAVVLQSFERFVKQRHKEETDAKIAEVMKENAIFKKAVQIQASRLAAKSGQDQEIEQLRQTVAQYQEQCRKLELHAYSLAIHLQTATANGAAGMNMPRPPPDVY